MWLGQNTPGDNHENRIQYKPHIILLIVILYIPQNIDINNPYNEVILFHITYVTYINQICLFMGWMYIIFFKESINICNL